MSLFYWGLLVGTFLGTWLGIFVIGLCVAAKRSDPYG